MKKIFMLVAVMIMSLVSIVGCSASKTDLSIEDIEYNIRENTSYEEFGEIDYKVTLQSSSAEEIYVENFTPIVDGKIEDMLARSATKGVMKNVVPNGAVLEGNIRVNKDPSADLEGLKKELGDADKIIKGFEFVVKVDGKEKTIKVMKK